MSYIDKFKELCEIIGASIIEHFDMPFVVATVLAVVGIYYAAKAYVLSKQQADKQPKLTLSIYDQDMDESIYFVLPFKQHRKFIIGYVYVKR